MRAVVGQLSSKPTANDPVIRKLKNAGVQVKQCKGGCLPNADGTRKGPDHNRFFLIDKGGEPTVLVDHDLAMVWTPYWVRVQDKITHVGTNCFTLLKGRWPEGTTGTEEEMEWKICGITDTGRLPSEEDLRRINARR